MYSVLLSQADLGRVIAAAPSPREQVINLGLKVFNELRSQSYEDGNPVNTRYFGDIAKAIGPDVSPKEIGRVIRELGLSSRRDRDGYIVVWNQAQMEILKDAFKEEVK